MDLKKGGLCIPFFLYGLQRFSFFIEFPERKEENCVKAVMIIYYNKNGNVGKSRNERGGAHEQKASGRH